MIHLRCAQHAQDEADIAAILQDMISDDAIKQDVLELVGDERRLLDIDAQSMFIHYIGETRYRNTFL